MTPLSPKGSEHNKRAEEIAGRWYERGSDTFQELSQEIAKALEDAYVRGCTDTIHSSPMFESGAASMRERAAKLCSGYCGKSTSDYSEGKQAACEEIERAIRSLPFTPDSEVKPEVKNG